MCQLFRLLDRVAPTESSALVFGESGTGKELVAEAIHRNSARAAGPFVKVNCAAFVETLLLSELFGHERGAFTGATQRKKGRFELADGGTLFLDEIGDISPTTQVALLRVLQERTFERVGGTESVTSDVRLICATNRNLEAMVRSGQFRQDLYYRLKGVIIELPTLRARRSDIPALVRQALAGMGASAEARSFSADAMHRLVSYSWPGNVRELENLVRAVAVLADRPVIDRAQLALFDDYFADGSFAEDVEPAAIDNGPADAEPTSEPPAIVPPPGLGAASLTSLGLDEARERLEFELISQALTAEAGNIAAAARRLQVKRPRLSQLISAHPGLTELRERLLAGNDSTRDDTEATHESAS
jgi:DNA-binding NtrC family response regulator